jgi:uncharacterized protein (TIGR04255 family)
MIDTPFGSPAPEVPLTNAPLALVLAQLRFPQVASITTDEGFIGPFQEAIRKEYPVLRREQQNSILMGPSGAVEHRSGVVWRFEQHPATWQVVLASDFVALSTTVDEAGRSSYTNSDDFLRRLRDVVEALRGWLDPKICDRFGIRYVDRVTDPAVVAALPTMLRPGVVGVAGITRLSDDGQEIQPVHALADHSYRFGDSSELHARWAFLPPDATLDTAIEPVPVNSWVLDLDCYTSAKEEFTVDLVDARAKPFCDRIYRFFRWAVTDEFLRTHGGAP